MWNREIKICSGPRSHKNKETTEWWGEEVRGIEEMDWKEEKRGKERGKRGGAQLKAQRKEGMWRREKDKQLVIRVESRKWRRRRVEWWKEGRKK